MSVDVELRLPEVLQADLDKARRLRAEAEAAASRAADSSRGLVHALIQGEHMTQSDAAALLGISQQRVQQPAKA